MQDARIETALAEARMRLAVNLHQAGRFDEAKEQYRAVLEIVPGDAAALNNLATIALRQGQNEESVSLLKECIAFNPDYAAAFGNLGLAFSAAGREDEALSAFSRAVALDPQNPRYRFNLAEAYVRQGGMKEAEAAFRKAASLAPDDPEAGLALGDFLRSLEKDEEALPVYRRVVALAPRNVAGWVNLGIAESECGHFDEAIAAYRQALSIDPRSARAHSNLGLALTMIGDQAEALCCFNRAVESDPDYVKAYIGKASACHGLGQNDAAIANCRKAIALDPENAPAYAVLGGILYEIGDWAGAADAYARAEALTPGEYGIVLLGCKRIVADWDKAMALEKAVLSPDYREKQPAPPFALLNLSSTPKQQKEAGERLSRFMAKGVRKLSLPRRDPDRRKLSIGYLSGDFHDHPVTRLIVETLENHDRDRFEIVAYSYGRPSESDIRRRVKNACDKFVDIGPFSIRDSAQAIARDGIDVLVDLTGHTTGSRSAILASRPAPIIVNYLGFPGSMGADFIDYIIGDSYLTPLCDQPFFSEKIVNLPDCYQSGDKKRSIALQDRAVLGLPEGAVLLAAFNNVFKISPSMFSIWMRLLQDFPNAYLWLHADREHVRDNLRKEAEARGVSGDRLLFAERATFDVYLGRLALADLFLDCYPFNAGATANDVLWAGTPLLTCSGETYVSRMAGSLLRAVGLPELIASSLAEYESLAKTLIADPNRRASFRSRLAKACETSAAFDSKRHARALEAAYRTMWAQHEKGLKPQSFAVDPDLGDG